MADVAEIVDIDVVPISLPRLFVEKPHDTISVVADDPLGHVGRDLELLGQGHTCGDVIPDYLCGLPRVELVMRVGRSELVLDEEHRVLCLT